MKRFTAQLKISQLPRRRRRATELWHVQRKRGRMRGNDANIMTLFFTCRMYLGVVRWVAQSKVQQEIKTQKNKLFEKQSISYFVALLLKVSHPVPRGDK
jgi:hypothetical protein